MGTRPVLWLLRFVVSGPLFLRALTKYRDKNEPQSTQAMERISVTELKPDQSERVATINAKWEHPVSETKAMLAAQPSPKIGRAARDCRAHNVSAKSVGLS
jgi:hypothetical protein